MENTWGFPWIAWGKSAQVGRGFSALHRAATSHENVESIISNVDFTSRPLPPRLFELHAAQPSSIQSIDDGACSEFPHGVWGDENCLRPTRLSASMQLYQLGGFSRFLMIPFH